MERQRRYISDGGASTHGSALRVASATAGARTAVGKVWNHKEQGHHPRGAWEVKIKPMRVHIFLYFDFNNSF